MVNSHWSEQELIYLKNNYVRGNAKIIARQLNRTLNSIRNKTNLLGLDGTDNRWKPFEVEYLKNNYGIIETKEIAKQLNRNRFDINYKASSLGIKLPLEYYAKYPFKPRKGRFRKDGYGVIGGKNRKLIHREVWEAHNGKIPWGKVIHHKDENPSNNSIENLQLMRFEEHAKLHYGKREINERGELIGTNK